MKITEAEIDALGKRAIKAKELSYSPYSNFRVGCSLITESGDYFDGANIENASYGGSICAERATICSAVLKGQKKLCVIGIASDLTDEFITPCGICRQFIREFGVTIPIYMFKNDGSYIVRTLEELLPMSFGPDQLS